MSHKETDSIYVDLCGLRKEVRKASYLMEVKNRILYVDDTQREIAECIRLFVRARKQRSQQGALPYMERLDEEFAVVNFNRCPRPGKVEAFIATINSYFGIFKRRNAYGILRDTVDAIAPAWFEFIHYDDQRRTITANPGYGHHALIARKYKLKYNENGNTRKTTERIAVA